MILDADAGCLGYCLKGHAVVQQVNFGQLFEQRTEDMSHADYHLTYIRSGCA
jgi:hypothetical protein